MYFLYYCIENVAQCVFNSSLSSGPPYCQHTSSTSARRLLASLIGHTSVLLNAATCWFLAPELSSADGVFLLLHRPFGTLFRHTCARH